MAKKENKKSTKSKEKAKSSEEVPRNVQFTFYSPDAVSVYVSGEFNGWDTQSLPMKKDKDGIWKSKVKLLPGRYEYKLFTDCGWIESLPDAETVSNPFGTQNFIILVK